MRHTLTRFRTNQQREQGFTLVEVAVVLPMMIFITLGLVSLLVALVIGIAAPTKRNALVNSSGNVLESVNRDVTSSSGFLASVPFGFSDSNNADYTSPPANTEVLIIKGYNQTKEPTDTTGTQTLPAFKGTPPCSATTNSDKSNIASIITIYFVKGSTIWRRVLTETSPGATCNTPLLITQTCPPGGSCTNEDTPIVKGSITEFKLIYYTDAATDTVATNKIYAKSVLLSIKGSVVNGNDTTTYSSNLRISRISD